MMENLQHKLRFPEFKDDWKKTALKNIGTVITGTTPSTSNDEYYNGNNLFLSPADINNNRFVYNTKTKLTDLGFSKTRRLKSNSIAFVCIGSTIGKIAQVKKEFATNQQINSIEVFENFSEDFGYYSLLNSSSKIKTMASVQTVPQINKSDFSKINLLFPSLPEQTKIADFLGAVDKQLELLTTKKEKLQLYKKGVMQKLFSKEIRFTKEDGTNYPDWEEKTLGEVATFYSGGTPTSTNTKYYGGNIPFIKSGEINSFNTAQFLTEEGLKNSSAKLVNKGDLLYALYGATSGQVAISKINGAINQAVLCIRSKELSLIYLKELLYFNKQNIVDKYIQGGQGNLSASIIKKLEYRFPSVEEQNQIADFLTAIDNQIDAIDNQITKTENYKKGLLQQMFV